MGGSNYDAPTFPSVEHIVPDSRGRSFGGPTLIICRECNNNKGDLSLDSFLRRLVARNDPRAEHVRAWMAAHPDIVATVRTIEARIGVKP